MRTKTANSLKLRSTQKLQAQADRSVGPEPSLGTEGGVTTEQGSIDHRVRLDGHSLPLC